MRPGGQPAQMKAVYFVSVTCALISCRREVMQVGRANGDKAREEMEAKVGQQFLLF